MRYRNYLTITAIAVTALLTSCNKKSKSSGDNVPVAQSPGAEEKEQVSNTDEGTTDKDVTKKPTTETATGTAGQAQEQLGLALQDIQYDQFKSPPITFAQVGTIALDLGRSAEVNRSALALRSSRSVSSSRDIDFAEQKFSWEPAQDPIKSSEKIRCLMEKSEYIAALSKAMKERPKLPPDVSDETKGQYVFNVAYRWTTNVKQSDLKTACLSDGSSFGGGDKQGGGDTSLNKLAKFTGEVVTVVTANQTGVDESGLPEFDADIGPLTVKVWLTIDDSLMSNQMGSAGTMGGNNAGSSPQRNYYVTYKVDETPSLKNPNGKTEFNWTAFKVVDGNETDEVVAGRRIASADSNGNPTLSFRERLTHIHTWGTGANAAGYKMTNEQKASVKYKPAASGSTHGKPYDQTIARTSSSYEWEQIPASNNYTPSQDQSGSFSYVWDAASDRSLTKWIPNPSAPQWWGGAGMETFDPTLPVCRDTKNMLANVQGYGLFSTEGKKLQHRTYFMIETDKVDSNGWPIMGGIGTWGMWMYGVSDGETVYIKNDEGDRVSYTYKQLPGSLRDGNGSEVVPTSDLELACSTNCPLSVINSASAATRADGSHRYRYIAAERKLVFDPNLSNNGDEEEVKLAATVDNAFLTFNFTLASNSSVSYAWQVNRSRWTNAQMTENGMWFDFYKLQNNDSVGTGVYVPPSDVNFTCTENCLKSVISGADLTANPKTIFLSPSATPYCYVYRLSGTDWQENFKLYRDTTCDGFDAGTDVNVSFGSDVTTGSAGMAMKLAGSSPVRTIDFKLDKQEYGASAGLKKSDNTWFLAPVDLKFQPFTYSSATHAYPGMTHPSVDGHSTSASGMGEITNTGELSFGNGYLCCIQWGETDIPNAWGGKEWAPVATFRKGVPLTVANTTGKFTAGQEVLIAPTQTQLTSPPVNDCSTSLQTQVNALAADPAMALPNDTNLPLSNEREKNGQAPSTSVSGDPIQPLDM
jgi:hypothetical protein